MLDADYLTILPDDVDPSIIGPVLCAGVTAYKVLLLFPLMLLIVLTGTGCFEHECQGWELADRRGCWRWAWSFGW